MVHQIKREQQLKCNLETAWKFFSSPKNLAQITPPEMKFKVLTNDSFELIYEGMVIDYIVSPLFGIPMKWRTIIKNVANKKSFTDFQDKGPFKLWNHFHEFIENEGGVLVKDKIDYEIPFSKAGDILNYLIIKEKLKQIFDYRYSVLDKLFNKQIA